MIGLFTRRKGSPEKIIRFCLVLVQPEYVQSEEQMKVETGEVGKGLEVESPWETVVEVEEGHTPSPANTIVA